MGGKHKSDVSYGGVADLFAESESSVTGNSGKFMDETGLLFFFLH